MSEQQNQKYNQYTIIETENLDRYKIKRVAVLYDDTAYNYRRGIYEIVDTKTNKKYLGISGIGISELGNHSSGKTSTEDEQ